jgi:hypothetical protein
MDVEKDEARLMVKNNKHNCITATYYLMIGKKLRDPSSMPTKSSKNGGGNSPTKTDTINISKVVGTKNESMKKTL